MLKKWFGPSRKEVWTQLADATGAQFVPGGFWKGDKVEASHGDWTITLDTYTVSTGKSSITFTRIRAPYVNPDGFRFTIYRASIFSPIGKLLGMQDIEIGHEEFDRDFIIKATDESKVRMLLEEQRLRALIETQPQIHLSAKDDEGYFGSKFPPDADELVFQVHGVIKDIERLKSLFDLFAETLNQLCKIGSAYETAPDVTLK